MNPNKSIADSLALYLQDLSDEQEGINEDNIIAALDANYSGRIQSHKFTLDHGKWTAILVFSDNSTIRIESTADQFTVATGLYVPGLNKDISVLPPSNSLN